MEQKPNGFKCKNSTFCSYLSSLSVDEKQMPEGHSCGRQKNTQGNQRISHCNGSRNYMVTNLISLIRHYQSGQYKKLDMQYIQYFKTQKVHIRS